MKKAVCISCTHHYNARTCYVEAALRKAGYDCTYITSDFHHTSKQRHRVDMPHCIQIPTLSYSKNISVRRIVSHIRFAADAMKLVAKLRPDLLYVEIPPNSLCREAALYKKRNPNVTLIFDIFDMWPESFPGNRLKALLRLPFRIWAGFRNRGLPAGDLVLTECDLFQTSLQSALKDTPAKTLYLCRPGATVQSCKRLSQQDGISLCYLGAINNIIDIPAISALIGQVQLLKPVTVHVIGDGESREAFLSALEQTGASVVFHGKVYDNAQKQAIFDQCSFGLNIMKSSVFIGLTMKSVDYFAGGLPIINSIGGDSRYFVEQRGMGIQFDRENPAETARQIATITPEAQLRMAENTLDTFHALFTQTAFEETLLPLL